MAPFIYHFEFLEDDSSKVEGVLELDSPTAYSLGPGKVAYYRTGSIQVKSCPNLALVLYHNEATADFMYLRQRPVDENLLSIVGLSQDEIGPDAEMVLPGQLCL